ncbi:hypothetical protein HEE88_001636 [Campylobacter upsaliensis]|uniref:Uncharacterized protein n=1 Tax=Campylobacter upsaliensis TaxID=28080 RepID=A0A5L4DG09_CAMUP|nr:hypothetical protein [Campylobacter upsaliensis]EAH5199827.1 hypothetical protein [Campylobacter upsaliensis]EAI2894292.1 hypothetical protein [Campylobacter upsaliensis]EAI4456876.1 hypothetical protein [Campylobacter upsaliensis]EAI6143712.1 hypothetical protein [Campylobacter upsaliensis]
MGTTKMKDKIEFIKRYYTSAFKSQELFLEGLLDDLEDTEGMSMSSEDRNRQKGAYKKALQRGSPKGKIDTMYKFLSKQDKIAFAPLSNDEFEKKTLGKRYYDKLCNFIKNYRANSS